MTPSPVSRNRWLTVAMGGLFALTAIGLIGFALTLIYADLLHGLPSQLVVGVILTGCICLGLYCGLVALRLLDDRFQRLDRLLLDPGLWRFIGSIIGILGLALLVRWRLLPALVLLSVGWVYWLAAHHRLMDTLNRTTGR